MQAPDTLTAACGNLFWLAGVNVVWGVDRNFLVIPSCWKQTNQGLLHSRLGRLVQVKALLHCLTVGMAQEFQMHFIFTYFKCFYCHYLKKQKKSSHVLAPLACIAPRPMLWSKQASKVPRTPAVPGVWQKSNYLNHHCCHPASA